MNRPEEDPRFQWVELIGQGGTAGVAKVYHHQFQRELALKFDCIGTQESSANFRGLVRREHELIGDFRYPGIVRLMVDPQPDYRFLLLELCSGPTLNLQGRLNSTPLVLNLLSAIAIDLEFLNAAGIIHGDLKPHNIFLPTEAEGKTGGALFFVKLSDFSLGRRFDEPEEKRLGLGTIGYMAPETISDGRTSHRSDLFALGIIAYQMFTGAHPFLDEGSEPVQVNSRIREQDPPPLERLRPDLDRRAIEIVNRLLAKNENDRPDAAIEVCRALQAAGASYPFTRALRPADLLRAQQSYDQNVESVLHLTPTQNKRLALLTGGDLSCTRLLLNSNFRSGNLIYANRRFHFKGNVIWPERLRRESLRSFSQLNWSQKKQAITLAVVGDAGRSDRIEPFADLSLPAFEAALPVMLLPLLRPATVRRLAATYARTAERQQKIVQAAELYLKAGSLESAERAADEAARMLNREHDNSRALTLLREVIDFSSVTGHEFETRQLLLLKGTIHKENGDLRQASVSYNRIIELYRQRRSDKLLAETYKDLGDLYRLSQDFSAGLEALKVALDIYTELGDELEISHTFNNLGNLYSLVANNRQARLNYRAALKIQKKLKIKADFASTLHNLASLFCADGRVKRGIFLLDYSLKLKKEVGHAGEIARTLNNLGWAYNVRGRSSRATDCLAESLEINRRIGSKKEILHNLENLTSVMITAGRLKGTLGLFEEGLALAGSLADNAHLVIFRTNLARVLKRMGRFGEAEQSLAEAESTLRETDDRDVALQWAVQRASLRYELGDCARALKELLQVYRDAGAAGHSVSRLNCLLLITRLTDENAYRHEGMKLIEEMHLVREKLLLGYSRIEYLLENDRASEAAELAEKHHQSLSDIEEDIELPWIANISAELLLETGRPVPAADLLRHAHRAAQNSGLVPELIVTLALQGRLARLQGNYESAFESCREALQLSKKIIDTIDREDDHRLFQNKRVMQALAQQIRSLGECLGQKERAGL